MGNRQSELTLDHRSIDDYIIYIITAAMTNFRSPNVKFSAMLWVHHKVGFLDEMLNIFDYHNHPVVIVGDQALRWMAVGLMTNEVRCKFSLL